MAQTGGGRGFDRSYKRGAVMGLTVAEAFILLSFCLLLLFTWWQIDTEKRSLIAADTIAEMTPEQKAEIIAGLSDGTFAFAAELRKAGVDASNPQVLEDLKDYASSMREEDFHRLMETSVKLSPQTRISLADLIETTDEVALKAALEQVEAGRSDGTFAAAAQLRKAGVDASNPEVLQDLKDFARFMREEDFQRLMEASVKLSPQTRLSLADTVEVTDEVALRAALAQFRSGDSAAERVAGKLAASAAKQGDMVELLNARLGDQIRKAGGSIDGQGTITLPQSVLFDAGQDRLRDPDFLRNFCGSWIAALRTSDLDLSELKIEGHASSEGRPGQDSEAAYLYNLDLSQRRAKSALNYCLDGVEDPYASSWASERLAAVGYSSARLIMNPDGSENREASRRVMFSVSVNQDALIEDIKQDVGEGEVAMQATGPARVIDGDTIEIQGTSYRVSGIDAPERGQPCTNSEGRVFDCGEVARRGLESAIGGQDVTCLATTVDRYNRPVATCSVGLVDLGKIMVIQGLAVPFEEYSTAYVSEGTAAKSTRTGLWNTNFDMPWEYRASK